MGSMDTKIRRIIRTAAATSGLAVAVLLLTGCSKELTLKEAQSSPDRVIETSSSLLNGPSWSYVNSDGKKQRLSTDCSKGVLSDPCWSNSDGTVKFSYYVYKGSYGDELITLKGKELKSDCVSTDFWGGVEVCAPLPREAK